MVLNSEIGMETGVFLSDSLSVTLHIVIIYVTCLNAYAAPITLYTRPNKRQYYSYLLKNRQNTKNDNDNNNDADEYDKPLVYRDLYLNSYKNENSKKWTIQKPKNTEMYSRKNRLPKETGMKRNFDRTDGMQRILTFPLKDNNRIVNSGLGNGDSGTDCLTGGLDAGVINGALKIGIGVGLASECGTSTEKPPPKMVPFPVFIPRAVPVPQPYPYPVAIDVPRPVPIRVPQPYPYPMMNNGGPLPMMGPSPMIGPPLIMGRMLPPMMGPPPMMGRMLPPMMGPPPMMGRILPPMMRPPPMIGRMLPPLMASRMMNRMKGCPFQKRPSGTQRRNDQKDFTTEKTEYTDNNIIPDQSNQLVDDPDCTI